MLKIRLWKKSLYQYFDEEPSSSCAGSICGSESENEKDELMLEETDGSQMSVKTSVSNISASSESTLSKAETPTSIKAEASILAYNLIDFRLIHCYRRRTKWLHC